MAKICVTDREFNENNLLYIQTCLNELFYASSSTVCIEKTGDRSSLVVACDGDYSSIVAAELADKVADVVAINYKYEFFKKTINVTGLNAKEYEILLTSLIAADLEEDKRYTFEKIKGNLDITIDGIFNFRLKPLKKKWHDIVSFMPPCFVNSQLKEFVCYLLENKRQKIMIDNGRVFDNHYRRLTKAMLLGGENIKIIREVLLSNCGKIEISGKIPEEDEYYLKEFYEDKIYFSCGYFN